MTRLFLTLALVTAAVVALAAPAPASEYAWHDGYYWNSGIAYTRTDSGYWYKDYYWVPGCYSCGYYAQGYWAFTWKWYPSYSYSRVQLNYDAPDLETQLIRLAANRDAAVLSIAKRNAKHANAMEMVDKLGLAGNFSIPSYGAGLFPFAGYQTGSVQLSAAGVQGNTVYGNSYQRTDVDAYGTTDLNVIYQQMARTTEQQIQAGDNAQARQAQVVQLTGAAAARVAEIQARAAAAERTFRATQAAPQITASVTTIGSYKGPGVEQAPPPRILGAAFDVTLPGPATCVECHSGQTAKGGFDVVKYNPDDPQQRARVLDRLLHNDVDKQMPKGKPRLSGAQMMAFMGGQPAVGPAKKE